MYIQTIAYGGGTVLRGGIFVVVFARGRREALRKRRNALIPGRVVNAYSSPSPGYGEIRFYCFAVRVMAAAVVISRERGNDTGHASPRCSACSGGMMSLFIRVRRHAVANESFVFWKKIVITFPPPKLVDAVLRIETIYSTAAAANGSSGQVRSVLRPGRKRWRKRASVRVFRRRRIYLFLKKYILFRRRTSDRALETGGYPSSARII